MRSLGEQGLGSYTCFFFFFLLRIARCCIQAWGLPFVEGRGGVITRRGIQHDNRLGPWAAAWIIGCQTSPHRLYDHDNRPVCPFLSGYGVPIRNIVDDGRRRYRFLPAGATPSGTIAPKQCLGGQVSLDADSRAGGVSSALTSEMTALLVLTLCKCRADVCQR